MKEKKCKICKQPFNPYQTTQKVCSPKCAIEHAKKDAKKKQGKAIKEQRKAHREQKKALKSKLELAREAQQEYNKWIRHEDKDEPCISCGRYHQGQYHAGHYRTTKTAPQLRFNRLNVHKQCSACNNHLSGNIGEYRINLIKKIGIELVEWIESNNEPSNFTRDELIEIKQYYRWLNKTYVN